LCSESCKIYCTEWENVVIVSHSVKSMISVMAVVILVYIKILVKQAWGVTLVDKPSQEPSTVLFMKYTIEGKISMILYKDIWRILVVISGSSIPALVKIATK